MTIFEQAKQQGYTGTNSLSLIREWLRIDKEIYLEIFFSIFHKKWSLQNFIIDLKKAKKIGKNHQIRYYNSYEEVQKTSIKRMLKEI